MFDIKCIAIRFQTVARNSILRFQWLRHWNSYNRYRSLVGWFVFSSLLTRFDRPNVRQTLFSLKIEIRVLLNNIKSIAGKVSESKRANAFYVCMSILWKGNTKSIIHTDTTHTLKKSVGKSREMKLFLKKRMSQSLNNAVWLPFYNLSTIHIVRKLLVVDCRWLSYFLCGDCCCCCW